jgi:hypothetical protein
MAGEWAVRQLAKFKIHLEPVGTNSYVELNGERLPMVRDVYVDGRLDEVPTVHITFVPDEVEITGEMEGTDEPPRIEIKVSPDFREIERMVKRAIARGIV